MATIGPKCIPAPMTMKTFNQQLTDDHRLKKLSPKISTENKIRCQQFRIHGLGGGDGTERGSLGVQKNEEGIKTRGTQTDYRESEAQTSPWEAPYKVRQITDKNPEVLSLIKSTWGNGLPAGVSEVRAIKRMRIKKAWMEALPPMDTPSNMKICEEITTAIEANEWAFREAELQSIMDSRMALMEKLMEQRKLMKEKKMSQRIERFSMRLRQQRDKRILNIRGTFLREVRKLNRKHRGTSASCKLHRSDKIARHANRSSQMYAPEMRFGFRADGRHEVLDKSLLSEIYVDREMPADNVLRWLPTEKELKNVKHIPKPDELCVRRTRWTDEKLRQLHADLKTIRLNDSKKNAKKTTSLLKRKIKLPALPVTPLKVGDDSAEKECERNSLFLQKITRGRAIQSMMFEGRNRCKELIEELRSTHSLRDSGALPQEDKGVVNSDENEKMMQDNRVMEIFDSLEGMTVSGMLDLLSKEEIRLREERKAHALALLAERERNRREAEESGRRQFERNRRRELDEMFRQLVKVNQDSVEAYLQDVIKEGIDWAADREARQCAESLEEEFDEFMDKSEEDDSDPAQVISEMVHNLLLPEVDKDTMKKKIRDKQRTYVRAAHQAIYNEILEAACSKDFSEGETFEKITSEDSNAEDNVRNSMGISSEDNELYDEIGKLTGENELLSSETENPLENNEEYHVQDD